MANARTRKKSKWGTEMDNLQRTEPTEMTYVFFQLTHILVLCTISTKIRWPGINLVFRNVTWQVVEFGKITWKLRLVGCKTIVDKKLKFGSGPYGREIFKIRTSTQFRKLCYFLFIYLFQTTFNEYMSCVKNTKWKGVKIKLTNDKLY